MNSQFFLCCKKKKTIIEPDPFHTISVHRNECEKQKLMIYHGLNENNECWEEKKNKK